MPLGKSILIPAASVVGIFGLYGFWRWLNPKTVVQVATEIAGCTADANANCLDRYITEKELLANGMDKRSFEMLVSNGLSQIMAGSERNGPPIIDAEKTTGIAVARIPLTGRDGSKMAASGKAILTPNGIEGQEIVLEVIGQILGHGYDRDKDADPRPYFRDNIKKWRAKLESWGIRGTMNHGLYMSWDDFVKDLDKRIAEHPVQQK